MKRNTSFILIFIAILGLLTLSSCKRAAVDDPKVVGPAGYRISVVGKADPAILHVPQGMPAAYATVTVKVLDNAAKPVVNKSIVFTDSLMLGYFTDSPTSQAYKVSDTRLTDSNGIAQIYYIIAPNSPINETKHTFVICTLQDDGRNDTSLGTPFDQIPVTIIPYAEGGYYLGGRVLLENQTPLEGQVITLTDMADKNSAIAVTKSDGSYGFLVKYGWTGKLTPPTDGNYRFMPTQYTFYPSAPVTTHHSNLDFVVSSQSQLNSNFIYFNSPGSGGTFSATITNSLSSAPIDFKVNNSNSWISVDTVEGTTPTIITMTVQLNMSTSSRTGKVTLTANAPGVKNSPLDITIAQDSVPELLVTPDRLIFAANEYGELHKRSVKITSRDTLHWSPTSDTTWLRFSPSSGTNTGSTLTIWADSPNESGFSRSGYITLQAYDAYDRMLPGITTKITVTQTNTSADKK